jgi:hypothetical protein
MTDKKQYYKLDDVGIIGKQEKISKAVQKYHIKKTGEAIRQLQKSSNTTTHKVPQRVKKAS